MPIKFVPLPSEIAGRLRDGKPDAYGHPAERRLSDGDGVPCRHCLRPIPAGKEYLIAAHRPFRTLQPYAETGPIFLCAEPCEAGGGPTRPEILTSPDYIVRGYSADERIIYGTGKVVARARIEAYATALLNQPETAFVHVRSARNNCFQCAIIAA